MFSSTIIVHFTCSMLVLGAPQQFWPPKTKNYDIWGDIDKEDESTSSSHTTASVYGDESTVWTRYDDRTADDISPEIVQSTYFDGTGNETSSMRDGRVLNFFPLPVDDECLADDATRSGICLNTYECRIQGGTSKGQCALGFGVCCVFTATCDQEVFNNITYIVSPNFPSLMTRDIKSCKLKIKMMSADVSQLRFDFVHFSMGQPNRSTGICDGDHFLLTGGAGGNFSLCGQNHGQHMYYDVPALGAPNETAATREEGDSVATDVANGAVELIMNFSDRFATSRLFEIRVTQIPFSQRAPAGCMQYFTGVEGVIQTFNFAENGRHLANQNYRSCVRQETGMCSIQYEPCFPRAFRIGPRRSRVPTGISNGAGQNVLGDPSSLPVNGALLPGQQISPLSSSAVSSAAAADAPVDQLASASADDPNAVEGSGGGELPSPSIAAANLGADAPAVPVPNVPVPNVPETPAPAPSFFSLPSLTSFFRRGFFGFGGTPARKARSRKTNEHVPGRHERHRQSRQQSPMAFYGSQCTDRITLPCVVEDFIAAGMGSLPACLPIHCGDSLCAEGVLPCRIESTVTPFGVGVHFGNVGEDEEKGSPEDNIGACLRYNQQSCL